MCKQGDLFPCDLSNIDTAAYFGHLDVVKFLVNVDPHNYDHAIELAKDGDESEIVDFLKAYTAKK